MSRYINADNAIERLGAYLMADAQIEYGGMASEDINDWKELASDILKGTPHINLADYVPKDFHDKTCEAMAKAHQEEIANMVRVVRCKECIWRDTDNQGEDYCTYAKGLADINESSFCSWGERKESE